VLSVAQSQLFDALTQVRLSRHHASCRCCCYRRTVRIAGLSVKAAGYCNVDEWRYCEMVDRILTTIQRQSF
jgi:hypothetical protein